jgi:hypothetical protein
LKAKVDVCVETFIAAHHQDKEQVAKINKVRTEWLKEIDECENYNLIELKKRLDYNLELEDEELFKKFIFEFEVSEGNELIDLRLIAMDTFMRPGKVKCFQRAMKVFGKNIADTELEGNLFEKPIGGLAFETGVI